MNEFAPIRIEWNCYNGFIFHFIHLDLYKPVNIDASLFGVSISKNFFYVDIFFTTFTIFENFEN